MINSNSSQKTRVEYFNWISIKICLLFDPVSDSKIIDDEFLTKKKKKKQ